MKDKSPTIYCVGGAVRDGLLGLPVQDHDWVVVGATPEKMEALGYRPVGKDFPVFLHPDTHEEYALARTERKTALGYKGFAVYAAPDVTLEQDLSRRDFTVNAIARAEDGSLIDPYHGIDDLRAGILRHVSAAFSEDPVRILRAARFVARFGFSIAPETLELMKSMVSNGEVDALVPERVWQELARGLMEKNPSRFITTLRDCGALKKILPEVDALFGVPQPPQHHPEIDCGIHTMMVLDDTAIHDYALEVRFAALMHDLGKANTPKDILPRHIGHEARSVDLLRALCERLRVPGECRDLGLLVARYHGDVHRARELRPDTIVRLFQNCDAWRKPERFTQLLEACASDARGRSGHEQDEYPQAAYLQRMLRAAQAVNAGEIARQCVDKNLIAERVKEARIVAVEMERNK
ncbi:MAG: multifunctional CCA tRNA nucleotidyl transferase/2'3'-cyclic phosphodiesterase/2'nucleotidase/phosphatase [Gallionellales bacterium 35-53-114]|jgi:tRNA nucleotidyltransferase (CCA-adding enzyme)|nr:MAG: multifunctional CCA tRNA nucleotidyl transferase/2'3'-cyclic phosphodiesterase/2'nucleotidase/phosphatase [Gallionellales bacterium 35-53-114]OYZ64360.1 MAG: multifunctional CCA tRNA nucleotidyl transferase/2'3'-cyclic phosphodiesterase/2'nucleotidase/phosphatase [Gallionellales bacterium 24-53-125]OZB10331.1 MAG: multifunctional CCA tRNA nucleotidyl transferase/2'3'-cyclic phosphodiesterase/2'nucleotidase/phosphatase [Gallionellales bacterium 39-52-133]HQS56936.1 multifunctional CCA add